MLTHGTEKLSRIAKGDAPSDRPEYTRSAVSSSPAPWENRVSDAPTSLRDQPVRPLRPVEFGGPRSRNTVTTTTTTNNNIMAPSERAAPVPHVRSESTFTGSDFIDPNSAYPRKHDYDLQSMEASLVSPPGIIKNPIPPPSVTVRSEFPTVTRSRQQQSLTCLVTVEVTEGKWQPSIEDIRPIAPPTSTDFGAVRAPRALKRANSTYESRQHLEQVTEELHDRVDNWHGLDFSRFGKLRLHGQIRVGKDRRAWQDLECYLFSEMLICVKERRPTANQAYDGPSDTKKQKCTLKGSILIKRHLKEVETFAGKQTRSS